MFKNVFGSKTSNSSIQSTTDSSAPSSSTTTATLGKKSRSFSFFRGKQKADTKTTTTAQYAMLVTAQSSTTVAQTLPGATRVELTTRSSAADEDRKSPSPDPTMADTSSSSPTQPSITAALSSSSSDSSASDPITTSPTDPTRISLNHPTTSSTEGPSVEALSSREIRDISEDAKALLTQTGTPPDRRHSFSDLLEPLPKHDIERRISIAAGHVAPSSILLSITPVSSSSDEAVSPPEHPSMKGIQLTGPILRPRAGITTNDNTTPPLVSTPPITPSPTVSTVDDSTTNPLLPTITSDDVSAPPITPSPTVSTIDDNTSNPLLPTITSDAVSAPHTSPATQESKDTPLLAPSIDDANVPVDQSSCFSSLVDSICKVAAKIWLVVTSIFCCIANHVLGISDTDIEKDLLATEQKCQTALKQGLLDEKEELLYYLIQQESIIGYMGFSDDRTAELTAIIERIRDLVSDPSDQELVS
ncbi:MAG: hypothetical protein HY860_01855 [Chlamydiales bacterium]|nr:hypothetical protein [Chlamydiales bacterium]